MKKSSISRRNFLGKAATVGVAGVVVPSIITGCAGGKKDAAVSSSLVIGEKIRFDSYDVAVIGSGSGGLSAAIAAARNGAKVLLIDSNGYLGGLMASGSPLLGFLDIHGRPVVGGFATEFVDRLTKIGASQGVRNDPHHYSVVIVKPDFVKIVASDLCEENGIDVLLHSYLTAAETENGKISRAIFSCAGNTIEVSAKIFIDGTGDATLAYLSGAAYQKGNENGEMQPPTIYYTLGGVDKEKFFVWSEKNDELGPYTMEYLRESSTWCFVTLFKLCKELQPKGEWPISVGAFICINSLNDGQVVVNGPRMINTDATDPRDLTKAERKGAHQAVAFTEMLRKYVGGFEHAYISHINNTLGIRETRRIVGKKMLALKQAYAASVPEDTIALAAYFIDIHSSKDSTSKGYKIEEPFGIPYLCLVSETIDNLMMTGRCISVDPYVFGSTRVMGTCLPVGEAAGVGAALAIRDQCSPAAVDVAAIRQILTKNGAILSMK